MTEPIGRRSFLRLGGQLTAAIPLVGLVASNAKAADSACVEIDSEPLRASLNYVDPSPHQDKHCRTCAFFDQTTNASRDNAVCARCQIMSGPVNSSAYCDSYAPAPKKG